MRWLVAALALLHAAPAMAGPIRVEIRPETEPRDPFVVSVTGHYASIHNGNSRRWLEAPLRAGPRRFIPLGPVNALLNVGVSVSVGHPDYIAEYARSHSTPLLVRPVGFETFRPRTWRSYLASGGPLENGGPSYPLGQILGHFQYFLFVWLPTIDAAGEDLQASEESVRSYVPLFDDLARLAMTDAAAVRPAYLVSRSQHEDPVFMRNLSVSDEKQRAEVRDLLFRIREWVSVPRADRVRIRAMMEAMQNPQRLSEELMSAGDRTRVSSLLDGYAAARDAGREPEIAVSWASAETGVEYRVRVEDPPRACADVGISADLTGVVSADLGEMTDRVKARFCRRTTGEWGFGAP
jgi:hypothetical protein